MFERFTDRARRVLVLAQEEARLLDHNFIGTEHILLGLLAEEEGVAARALAMVGVSLERSQTRVSEIIGAGLTGSSSGSPPFTPRAKKGLEYSLRQALQLGHSYIGTEHILLGLLREGEGVACQVLVGLGADLGRVRQETLTLMGMKSDPHDQLAHEPGGQPILWQEEGRELRQQIEHALTSDPGAEVLRRYLAGEMGAEEISDGTVTRALAESLVRQQELLHRLAQRFLPGAQ
jgi:ATP-dependent Clp protease ATP-binding subunit ClpA